MTEIRHVCCSSLCDTFVRGVQLEHVLSVRVRGGLMLASLNFSLSTNQQIGTRGKPGG